LFFFSIIYGIVVGILLDLWMGAPAGGMYIIGFFVSSLASIMVFLSIPGYFMRMTKLRLVRSLLGIHVGILVAFAFWYFVGWPFLSKGDTSPPPFNYIWRFVGYLAGLPIDFACVGVGLLASKSLDYVIQRVTKDTFAEYIQKKASPSQEKKREEASPPEERKPASERDYLV